MYGLSDLWQSCISTPQQLTHHLCDPEAHSLIGSRAGLALEGIREMAQELELSVIEIPSPGVWFVVLREGRGVQGFALDLLGCATLERIAANLMSDVGI